MYVIIKVKKKTISIKLNVLIQPNLVKKSYLYRGIPPRIKIKNTINSMNFNPNIIDAKEVVFIKKIGWVKSKIIVQIL